MNSIFNRVLQNLNLKTIHKIYNSDSLYKNTIYIISNSFSMAVLGSLFWIIAARIFPVEAIGLGSVLISSATMICSLSSLGLGVNYIRHLPSIEKKSCFFITTLTAWIIVSIILFFIFRIIIQYTSPEMVSYFTFINCTIFIIFIIIFIGSGLVNSTLITLNKSRPYYYQNLIQAIRIPILFLFIPFGALGIITSFEIALLLSLCYGLYQISKHDGLFIIKYYIDPNLIKSTFNFSILNYMSDLFIILQTSLLPILVLNVLGKEFSAYYFTAFSISSILFTIINSVVMAVLIKGSQDNSISKLKLKQSIYILLLIIAPIGFVLFELGDMVLMLYGIKYSLYSFDPLRIFILSSIFVAINAYFIAYQRIIKEIKPTIFINFIILISTLPLAFFWMNSYQIIGVAYAYLVGQIIGSIFVAIHMITNNIINK